MTFITKLVFDHNGSPSVMDVDSDLFQLEPDSTAFDLTETDSTLALRYSLNADGSYTDNYIAKTDDEVLAAIALANTVINSQPMIRIISPVSTTKATATPISIVIVDEANNDAVITSINGTYYVPLKNAMTGALDQIIVLDVVNGIGSVEIEILETGIYDIAEEFIRPRPTARIDKTVDIVVV